MDYAVGNTGRVIVARLEEGESLYESIESLADKEKIKAAAVFITGGLRKAEVVVGPKQEKPELVPTFRSFTGPGEVLGVGTIYCDDQGQAKMHLHAGMSRGDEIVVGCPRGGASVFLILEVTIIEITGIEAARLPDAEIGVKLLKIK